MEKKIQIVENKMSEIESDMAINLKLKIFNFPVSLINSVRRTLLSDIPNVVFDKVVIHNNKTNAHNEFIKHRIKLIPIYRNEFWKILTYWDESKEKRVWSFPDDLTIPKFSLDEKKKTSSSYNDNSIQEILSNDFQIQLNDSKLKTSDFFKKDLWTGDYIKIMILKNQTDHLKLEATPTISFANVHSGFSPIGNVAYFYEKESNTTIEEIKQMKFKQINKERKNKNLHEFKLNSDEHTQFNESFDLMDAQRIYVKNKHGECSIINMDIESIGVIEPLQALIDAIFVLKLKVNDYLTKIIKDYKVQNEKIQFLNSTETQTTFLIHDETHTLGNLLTDYIRKLNDVFDKKVIILTNYKLVHPLEKILQFTIHINDNAVQDIITNKQIKTNKEIFLYLLTQAFKTIEKDLNQLFDKVVTKKINKASFQIINQKKGGMGLDSDDEIIF